MNTLQTEAELEDALAAPTAADVALLRRLSGDVVIIGAGGKMGPSLARRIKRATLAAGVARRVLAVARFTLPGVREELEAAGVETWACDLLRREDVAQLPVCENVLYLAGRKFGSSDASALTWASNTVVPAYVAEHFRAARIVVFSTGNVYSFSSATAGGAVETDAPAPRGEYAQSCLGRERVFEYFSTTYGTRCLLFRLNYAVDLRYGVLVDIARQVHDGQPVDVTVPAFNVIWQGDANSYALRALELCSAPPTVLNVTGPELISVRQTAQFFARRFGRPVTFTGTETDTALLSNAARCHRLLGYPVVTLGELLELVAHWIECGGVLLDKPTKFEVADGRF